MTGLRRAWAWVSGDQGPLHDDDLVVTRREFREHCAQEVEALAERDRTIQALSSVSRYRLGERVQAWGERNEARDERDRTRRWAVTLEQDCAQQQQHRTNEMREAAHQYRAAWRRACVELEVERANAVDLTRLLAHAVQCTYAQDGCAGCEDITEYGIRTRAGATS